jgi:hypothetical protein
MMYAVYIQTRLNPDVSWSEDEDGDTIPVDLFPTLKDARNCKKGLPKTEVSRPIIMKEEV